MRLVKTETNGSDLFESTLTFFFKKHLPFIEFCPISLKKIAVLRKQQITPSFNKENFGVQSLYIPLRTELKQAKFLEA